MSKVLHKPIWLVLLFFIATNFICAHGQNLATIVNQDRAVIPTKKELQIVSLITILEQIKDQYKVNFHYNSELLASQKVDVSVVEANKEDLDLLLVKLLKPLRLTYIKAGTDSYIITEEPAPVKEKKVSLNTVADIVITGKVTSVKDEGLPGVTVLVKGTTIGTTTSQDGSYSLNIPEGSGALIYSFIGYLTKEVAIPVAGGTVDIMLAEDTKSLDEVVVVGYGTVKKSDLTGSVASINRKDIGDRQVSDIGSLIQGRAAGVDVSQGKIRIRGITTFNNTDPLVVIDGFIGGNLGTVNANDIESVEVLKDASSTAIYGSRGANGVILITTKMGKPGPLRINASFYEGISRTPKKLSVLNASQYIDFVQEALTSSGVQLTPRLLSDEVRQDRTDWQNAVFTTGHKREFNLDFSGGSENASFFLALGYRHTGRITENSPADNDVYLRNKNDFRIKKWLRAGNNFAFAYNTSAGGIVPWNIDNMLNFPSYMVTGDPNNPGGFSDLDRNADLTGVYNPLAIAYNNHTQNAGLNLQTNLWAEIQPLKGLTYRFQAGVNGAFGRNQYWNDAYKIGGGTQAFQTNLSKRSYYSYSPLIENYLTYKKVLGKHDFSVMLGNTWQRGAAGGGIGVYGTNLADLSILNVLKAPTTGVLNDEYWRYAYLSYFGRINYQFNNKYLLTVNMRTDGSPKFAPSNRWGTFPSVAVAWKLHEENFIKNLNVFDQLKIRTGWGLSGNDAIGDFQYVSQVYNSGVYYPFGEQQLPVGGATVINNASNNIKWESTESKSMGADMAFMGNRITLTAEYFIKKTNDILFAVPRPVSLGYGTNSSSGSAVVNAASCENKGFELQLGYQSNANGLNYSFNGNYTYLNNKVTSLGSAGQPFLKDISRTDVGNPIGYFYGFKADGIFMTQ